MLLKDARQLYHAGVAGGVVRRLRARPGVLMTADNDEIVGVALDFADRDLHRPPAVLHIGPEPDPYGPCRKHLAQLQPSRARDADARQYGHFRLESFGRRIAPYRFDRAEWHGGIFRVTPVH